MRIYNIAIVIASDVIGGHEFQAASLAKELASYNRVVVLLNRGSFRHVFDKKGLISEVHDGLFFNRSLLFGQVANGFLRNRKIAKVLSSFDEVIVCAGAVEASVTVGIASLLNGISTHLYLPFFYDRRTMWGMLGSFYNFPLRVLLNLYQHIITINRIQARMIKICFKGRVSVFENTIENVPPLRLGRAEPRLVFIGRLDQQKRILELINALDYLENPYKQLLLIGDGPLWEQVNQVSSKALHIKINVLGWLNINEQAEILRPSDILVLNSAIEGEPMVLREASARGMIAIVNDIPGVKGVSFKALRFKSVQELRKLLISPTINIFQNNNVINKSKKKTNRGKQLATILDFFK
jgi:glycosyltransferase involved in cell wall biosynthesis